MSYISWFNEHAKKHRKIVQKLLAKNYTKEQIVDYFDFESMLKNESDFCPLYVENKKCHEMNKLNCYLCACPNFRFNDNGIKVMENKTLYSCCSIDSKEGRQAAYGDAVHQDCSKCLVPHSKEYVLKNFDLEWSKIMSECEKK